MSCVTRGIIIFFFFLLQFLRCTKKFREEKLNESIIEKYLPVAIFIYGRFLKLKEGEGRNSVRSKDRTMDGDPSSVSRVKKFSSPRSCSHVRVPNKSRGEDKKQTSS